MNISEIESVRRNVLKLRLSPYKRIVDLKKELCRMIGYDIDVQRILHGRTELHNNLRLVELDNGGSLFEGEEIIEEGAITLIVPSLL